MNDPQTFATNVLTVILPGQEPGEHHDAPRPRQQGRQHRRADPSVPIGGYTNDVLAKMGKSSEYGPDYVTAVKGTSSRSRRA